LIGYWAEKTLMFLRQRPLDWVLSSSSFSRMQRHSYREKHRFHYQAARQQRMWPALLARVSYFVAVGSMMKIRVEDPSNPSPAF
jgi:hypothetical protein